MVGWDYSYTDGRGPILGTGDRASRLPAGRVLQDYLYPRTSRLVIHAGLCGDGGRGVYRYGLEGEDSGDYGFGMRTHRSGFYRIGAGHGHVVGQAHLGHVLAVGRSPYL